MSTFRFACAEKTDSYLHLSKRNTIHRCSAFLACHNARAAKKVQKVEVREAVCLASEVAGIKYWQGVVFPLGYYSFDQSSRKRKKVGASSKAQKVPFKMFSLNI